MAAQGPDVLPIPGTRSITRLDENWASREVRFTQEELAEIRKVVDGFTAAGTRYPAEMLKRVEV